MIIQFVLFSVRYSSNILIQRRFSLSSSKRNVFKSLFDHFQYARKAKQAAQQRGIDLSNLTTEQQIKFKPILQLKSAFRVVNITMGLMAIIATSVWYKRRQKQIKSGKQIDDELKPIWMDLKYFKHKGAVIGNYLLPEQIVGKLNQVKNFQFNQSDCICASFPKSGTTLIQEIVYLIQTNFDYESAKEKDISDRYSFMEWPTVNLQQLSSNQTNKSRFFKTHLPPEFFNATFKQAKVIYVYRNPKDVTVSLFHFLRSINIELTYSGPWNQFVQSFLIDEVYYAPWWRHLNDYHSLNDSIFCVAYEDLLTNFRPTVRRLAAYLGKEKELTEEQLDKLEKWCSFDSMKKNPKVNYNWFREWGFVNKSFSFLRKGEIGDWLNHFDTEQSKSYDKMVSTRLSPSIPQFNYGISLENQQRLYDFHTKQNHSQSS
ncbi:unnamed protein product [Rotaria socialis]|uniref:Sulfotransferase domain-containing protein n=1 Tax=Rotaria socialis TaxID=392032 RepID=A0A817WI29_9BILA|nr:unnamed protein product [Rotaria socialis]CAF3393190.1 unnamed protein product [Rotaria socialis]CAF3433925.1 unnamed protein product [Rotaria socialis]CAF3507221.1 unnamed protein product [Rotaria socialis]CAF3738049.1 unnamed protein product [Rotaria socialis]